jgi:hypothetical protein
MRLHLYILCEGGRDQMLYERIAERVTGHSFALDGEFRFRHGSNFRTATAAARLLLNRFSHYRERQDIGLIIAVDNDRAPGHPGRVDPAQPPTRVDAKKAARYGALKSLIDEKLGPDIAARPVHAALAIPVEMIEDWVLRLLDPKSGEMPIFKKAESASAREFHGSRVPPPQLGDLVVAEACKRGISLDEIFFEAADAGDIDALASASPSFALFATDLRDWQP